MMIGRRQFFKLVAGFAASPIAAKVAAALPVLEPMRARYLSEEQFAGDAKIGSTLRIRLPKDYQINPMGEFTVGAP